MVAPEKIYQRPEADSGHENSDQCYTKALLSELFPSVAFCGKRFTMKQIRHNVDMSVKELRQEERETIEEIQDSVVKGISACISKRVDKLRGAAEVMKEINRNGPRKSAKVSKRRDAVWDYVV